MTRVSKDYAEYERGTKERHCSMCKHFEKPEACAIVVGKISAGGSCRYFERNKDEVKS